MPIRVIRLMEYTYPDAEAMQRDMQKWQVQGYWQPSEDKNWTIKSVTLPVEVFEESDPSCPECGMVGCSYDPRLKVRP